VQGNVTGGTFMFEMQQTDPIRFWAYVPQDAAFGVAPGVDAIVRVPELPDCESASEFEPSFLRQFNQLPRRSAFGPHAEGHAWFLFEATRLAESA
jgi:hypothetical protein